MKNWLVLANASRARVLELRDGGGWTHVADLTHTASRIKGSDLGDDRPGHVEGTGHGLGSASYQPRTDPHTHEHDRFAREVADVLNQGVAQQRCAGIVLCASNPFLGLVKAHLHLRAANALVRAVPSDYTSLSDEEAARQVGL